MIKELQYKGYATEPSDYECPDGQLATSINLISEDSQLKPVFQPAELAELPTGYKVVYIHDTETFTHYILHNTTTNKLYWIDESIITDAATKPVTSAAITAELQRTNPSHELYSFGSTEIYNVNGIGNTLVVLTENGMHYILWKASDYNYLGTQLTELELQITTWTSVYSAESEYLRFDSEAGNEDRQNIDNHRDAMMASYAKLKAAAYRRNAFVFPFFVRCAYRLYDGSHTMQSPPCLIYLPNELDKTVTISIEEKKLKVTTSARCIRLLKAIHHHYDELDKWSDIITGIDVFVSLPFPTIDEHATETMAFPNFSAVDFITQDYIQQAKDNANFYLIYHIPIARANELEAGVIFNAECYTNPDILATRPTLEDDYKSHNTIIANKSYNFNSRLNIVPNLEILFPGFAPALCSFTAGEQISAKARIVITKNNLDYVLESDTLTTYGNIIWLYYPDVNAKQMYVLTNETWTKYTLTAHSMLNGAYWISGDAHEIVALTDVPQLTSDNHIKISNKIYTSEVNNPFIFPAGGINTVGTGTILGISAAAKAMSQGQFGQFPLYAFTTEGVWALEVSSTGSYSARQPITRDVCINADSITQIDSSVLFATDRGIMLISGSETQCITDSIFSEAPFNVLDLPGIEQLHAKLGHLADACLPMKPFLGFLAGCRMLYDYIHQRIFVYNPTTENGSPKYTYAYVFSLKSKEWGMVYSNLIYSVNSYPDALAVTKDNKLVSFSHTDEQVCKGLFVTRPLKLEAPDVHKTISALIQRGHFQRGDVGTVLYGSRDLYTWHLIWSSKDHYLRGFRGTPYKYFRIAGLAALTDGKSIFGASVNFEPRHTNLLR